MTLTQANWIQRHVTDIKIWQVTQKLVDEKKLDRVPQALFQEIMDSWAYRTMFTEDDIKRQILNKLKKKWRDE